MNKDITNQWNDYLETPRRTAITTVKIDIILEQRMKEFLLSRRRIEWIQNGR